MITRVLLLLVLQLLPDSQHVTQCKTVILLKFWLCDESPIGSEFSSYKTELRNRVKQNDVTPGVTATKSFLKNFSRVCNSTF